MALPSVLESRDAYDRDLCAIVCVACGGRAGRTLLDRDEVRCERGWLERFQQARIDEDVEDAKDRASFTQSESRSVVACTACGAVHRDPRPSADELAETYQHDHYGFDALRRLAENQDAFFVAKLARLSAVFADLPPGSHVLEVGSFVGGFLHAARERGWIATGVDVGEETTRFTRERGFDVRHGDVLELELPRRYAAVFIWSTFDQLSDPRHVLERVSELLEPGGILVLRVPNGRFETACLAIRRAARGTRRAHHVLCAQAYSNFVTFPYLTGYTPESLRDLLETEDFACRQVYGDTILALADERTRPFAVREEQRYKRAVWRACRAAERTTGLLFDPWIDVIARSSGVRRLDPRTPRRTS